MNDECKCQLNGEDCKCQKSGGKKEIRRFHALHVQGVDYAHDDKAIVNFVT